VLVDEVAPMVTPEATRPTADVAIDRDRLREELTRRTADLQELETRLWQSEEEVQRERLENVRLVTDVDRLREQVDRSRIVEHERMQELERLGHELRRLELAYAELQGLYTTGDHRLRELEASMERGDDPPELVELEAQVRELKGERDQAQALERAAVEQARRRERELAEAGRTIRELRRSVEEHASVAANLRGELAVMQVEVEQFGAAVPALQERLRDHQRKILEREEEAGELQRRLEESVAEQQELRQRLRRYKQDLEVAVNTKEAIEQDLDRLRGELDAKRRSVEQLQQLVALGAGTGRGTADDHELQALRALLAQQTTEHAERLAQQEQQQRLLNEHQREKLARVQLEATIRAEEQEYLLYQLDTAEQRIWEMTDATDRSAARLAAGLAQLDKQKEQYEDLIDQLEVSRTLLAEAQDRIVELERQLASDKAKLARLTLDTRVPFEREDEESADGSAFDVMVVDHGEDDEDMEIAPPLQLDPDRPDPLAGIDFDDDEESMAVRLASPFQLTGAFAAAKARVVPDRDDDGPSMVLPSDRLHIELDDDDDDDPLFKPAPVQPARAPVREPPREQPRRPQQQQPLRTLPFLDDDDMFSIDTDSIELATPTPPPPPPDRPGFDQKLTDDPNSRIVIEILDDEAWPDDVEDKD
jgi:chromosome segregation ATPase